MFKNRNYFCTFRNYNKNLKLISVKRIYLNNNVFKNLICKLIQISKKHVKKQKCYETYLSARKFFLLSQFR